MTQARLKPIESPDKLWLKLAYWFSNRQFGKVITPLKIIYARLPLGFARWSGQIEKLTKKLTLPADLAVLVKIHVAQLNTCHFCIDIAKAKAIETFENHEKFFSVSNYQESTLFSASEKAALRYAEELTRDKNISDVTFQKAQQYFSEKQLVELAWVVTSEHVYNLMNIAMHIESDDLCLLQKKNTKAMA